MQIKYQSWTDHRGVERQSPDLYATVQAIFPDLRERPADIRGATSPQVGKVQFEWVMANEGYGGRNRRYAGLQMYIWPAGSGRRTLRRVMFTQVDLLDEARVITKVEELERLHSVQTDRAGCGWGADWTRSRCPQRPHVGSSAAVRR